MRINVFLAKATGLSRRSADTAVAAGKVTINGQQAQAGQSVEQGDEVRLAGVLVTLRTNHTVLALHKPTGYVCSRSGQGSKTVYELIPGMYHHLKTIGRLDKDSSGLVLLTDDGTLAHRLTHPSFQKEKVYEVELDKRLKKADKVAICQGVTLEDGVSKLQLKQLEQNRLEVRMSEGRNRQIRRTFAARGYTVKQLHRISIANYSIEGLKVGQWKRL